LTAWCKRNDIENNANARAKLTTILHSERDEQKK